MRFFIQMTTMAVIFLAIRINKSESHYLNKDYAQRKAKELILKYDSSFNAQLSVQELANLLMNEVACLNMVLRINQEKKKSKYNFE